MSGLAWDVLAPGLLLRGAQLDGGIWLRWDWGYESCGALAGVVQDDGLVYVTSAISFVDVQFESLYAL